MKCVVLGGGGFIGSAITERLLRDGHTIRVFERQRVEPYRTFELYEPVEWITGDMLNTHDVTTAIYGCDVVFHLISTTLPKNSNDDPSYDVQTNIVGSLIILNAMLALKIPKIIFISSGGTIYGMPMYLPIDECHPTEPKNSYGITKLAIEKYLLLYQRLYGIKAIILRVTNSYGERQRIETAQGAVGVFMHKALQGMPIDIWGDGEVIRDYLHISDVAEAFAQAINYSGSVSVFNISSGIGKSLNELLEALEEVLGMSITRRYLAARACDVPINILSHSLAYQEMGWSPQVTLKDGLIRTADWMRYKLNNLIINTSDTFIQI